MELRAFQNLTRLIILILLAQVIAPGRAEMSSAPHRGNCAERSINFQPLSQPSGDSGELNRGDIDSIAGSRPDFGDGRLATDDNVSLTIGNIAVDQDNNLLIPDFANELIRKVDTSTGIISTIAGNHNKSLSGEGVPATSSRLYQPIAVAVDNSGNLYISEKFLPKILRVDVRGFISSFAGSLPGFGGDGGQAFFAKFATPNYLTFDRDNNIYIADTDNHRIRFINLRNGIITTIAGNGKVNFNGDGGSAINAGLNRPAGLAIDKEDNLYIADAGNHRVRRVNLRTKIITTIAGNGASGFGGDNGLAINANLSEPAGLALDEQGNLFISDSLNHAIRRVDAQSGIITTVAGNRRAGFSGDGGPAIEAMLNTPASLAIDRNGNLYLSDKENFRVRKVDTAGIISTIASNKPKRFADEARPAINAILNTPVDLCFDPAGNIVFPDAGNHRVCRIDIKTGLLTTIAGNGKPGFSGDNGLAINASLYSPTATIYDAQGSLLIADGVNRRVRRVDALSGVITTIAGNGLFESSGDNGLATEASIIYPFGLALDSEGNLFIVDNNADNIRRVDALTGIITTIAGNGIEGFGGDGGAAVKASLAFPTKIKLDAVGNIYFTDSFNYRVRRIDHESGIITTIAGNSRPTNFPDDDGIKADTVAVKQPPGAQLNQNNGPATDSFLSDPAGLQIDAAGNLFVSDASDNKIYRIDGASGDISAIAGNGVFGFSGDGGPALAAALCQPTGMLIDNDGNLIFNDSCNFAIRIVKNIAIGGAVGVGPQRKVAINTVKTTKKSLTILGVGFGNDPDAVIIINGKDVTKQRSFQNDSMIFLPGNRKRLNLSTGNNQISVIAGGVTSNFEFMLE